MSIPFSAISDKDKEMIDRYRKAFASAGGDDDEYSYETTGSFCPVEKVLKPWSEAKENLYHLFGDKLILEYEYYFELERYEIANQLRDMLVYRNNTFNIRNEKTIEEAADFWETFRIHMRNAYEDNIGKEVYWNLDLTNLAGNKYVGNNTEMFGIKIQKGAKATKIIEKLANHWGIKNFESFRLVHSLGLNNKKKKGKLCLSIHPLDFMTMSDNHSGWSSCMSWMDRGCYRQGSVEMMNSENVVIAYLESAEVFNPCYGVEWNSKKWRQLFIVDPDILTGVKQYPYADNVLSRFCLDKLKELCPNMYYDEAVTLEEPDSSQDYDQLGLTNVTFAFSTCNMYSDFGSVDNFPIYVGLNTKSDKYYLINYSGESECMCCGSLGINWESTVLCNYCYEEEERFYCDHCSYSSTNSEDFIRLDDNYLCQDCYDDYAIYTIFGEIHDERNCIRLWFETKDGEIRSGEVDCSPARIVTNYHSYNHEKNILHILRELTNEGEYSVTVNSSFYYSNRYKAYSIYGGTHFCIPYWEGRDTVLEKYDICINDDSHCYLDFGHEYRVDELID